MNSVDHVPSMEMTLRPLFDRQQHPNNYPNYKRSIIYTFVNLATSKPSTLLGPSTGKTEAVLVQASSCPRGQVAFPDCFTPR